MSRSLASPKVFAFPRRARFVFRFWLVRLARFDLVVFLVVARPSLIRLASRVFVPRCFLLASLVCLVPPSLAWRCALRG